MLYSEKVMDHFRNPRNLGKMDDADGIGEVGNAKCGDIMKMYIKVKDGIIEDVKFNTFGCGSAIASSSMATEMIKGKSADDIIAEHSTLTVEEVNQWKDDLLNNISRLSDVNAELSMRVGELDMKVQWFERTCKKYIGDDWKDRTGYKYL